MIVEKSGISFSFELAGIPIYQNPWRRQVGTDDRFPTRDASQTAPIVPVDANAKIQAALLYQASPIIAGAVKDGKLNVVAVRYDIASGKVSLLA
jgi:hypothetical protein